MATPVSAAKDEGAPHRRKGLADSSPTAVPPPPTVTRTRKRLCENDRPPNSGDAQLAAMSTEAGALPSPQVVAAPKRDSLNVFDEAERQREKSPSASSTRHATYESLFAMTSKKKSAPPSQAAAPTKPIEPCRNKEVLKAVSPKLGKVRTPDRVKLERLKTAAPLLPTRSTKPLTVPVEFNFAERKPRAAAAGPEAATDTKALPISQVKHIVKQTVSSGSGTEAR